MTLHRRLEERLAAFKGTRGARCCSARATWRTSASSARSRGAGEVVFSDELNHASIIDGCRLSRAETFVYRHGDIEHLAWALERADGPRRADRHRLGLLDGRRRRAADRARRARARATACGSSSTRRTAPAASARAAAARSPRPGSSDEVDVVVGTLGKALGSYGAYVACDGGARALPRQPRAPVHLLDRAAAAGGRRRAGGARAARRAAAPRRAARRPTRAALRDELAREGFDVAGSTTQIVPLIVGDAAPAMRICEAAIERGVFAQAIRPPTVARGHVAAAAGGDGVAHQGRAARGRARARPRRAAGRLPPGAGEPVAAARETRHAPRADAPAAHAA